MEVMGYICPGMKFEYFVFDSFLNTLWGLEFNGSTRNAIFRVALRRFFRNRVNMIVLAFLLTYCD